MSSQALQKLSLQQLITLACDTVEDVLDLYREHCAESFAGKHPRLLKDVKALFTALQKYEHQILCIPATTLGIRIHPARKTIILLNHCGLLGKRLRRQIENQTFQDDTDLRNEVRGLTETVCELIHDDGNADLEASTPHAPDPPLMMLSRNGRVRNEGGRPCSNPVGREEAHAKDLVHAADIPPEDGDEDGDHHDYGDHIDEEGGEVDEKDDDDNDKSTAKRQPDGTEKLQEQLSTLESNEQSMLCHIRTLHAAIKRLNARHPMRHRLTSWEDLTDELPHLLDHLESTNELLKDFEITARPSEVHLTSPPATPVTFRHTNDVLPDTAATVRQGPPQHDRRPSTSNLARQPSLSHHFSPESPPVPALPSAPSPTSQRPRHTSQEITLRPPSPTDSNVSAVRSQLSRPRKTHRKDRTRASGGTERGHGHRN